MDEEALQAIIKDIGKDICDIKAVIMKLEQRVSALEPVVNELQINSYS